MRGRRIVLATFGTLGDVYPFVAIAGFPTTRPKALAPRIAAEAGVEAVADWIERAMA